MGRLHVSKAGTDGAFAEMDFREEGDNRWRSWPGRFGLLPGIVVKIRLKRAGGTTMMASQANWLFAKPTEPTLPTGPSACIRLGNRRSVSRLGVVPRSQVHRPSGT